jgi:hypothetical protein
MKLKFLKKCCWALIDVIKILGEEKKEIHYTKKFQAIKKFAAQFPFLF